MTHLSADMHGSARKAAYQCLFDVLIKDAYTNIAISRVLRNASFSGADRRLITELVYGVCRRYNYLVWIIDQLSTRKFKKIHPSVRILLCIGLYQLIFMDRIPEAAAVNETVAVAKGVTHAGNVRFVNAILRNYIRRRETITQHDLSDSLVDPLSLTHNQPIWLIRHFEEQYGRDAMIDILKNFSMPGSVFFRVNRHKISDQELEEQLLKNQVEFERVLPEIGAYCLKRGISPDIWKLLDAGLIYIQNLSSMVPPFVLAPEPGDTVLDMCAAPGSKTTQMADMMRDTGRIVAWDLYPHKIKLINQNARRMGFTCIQAQCRDSLIKDDSLTKAFDRILVDAPCSGLGVLGHKPELRWKRTSRDLETFPPLQLQLLQRAASYLKEEGTLVYSTCTLNKDENENIISRFLSQNAGFTLQPFSAGPMTADNGILTIFPDTQGRDGFFVAKLTRRHL